MKKLIFCAVVSALSIFNIDALLINEYREKAHLFNPDTDLIRGLILLERGALFEQRHIGNFKYYGIDEGRNDPMTCSYKDEGKDAMSRLLGQLFPSAGGSGLNATGAGAITKDFSDEKVHISIIAGMFKIANAVRKGILLNRDRKNVERTDGIEIFADIQQIEAKIQENDLDKMRAELVKDETQAEFSDEDEAYVDDILKRLDVGKPDGDYQFHAVRIKTRQKKDALNKAMSRIEANQLLGDEDEQTAETKTKAQNRARSKASKFEEEYKSLNQQLMSLNPEYKAQAQRIQSLKEVRSSIRKLKKKFNMSSEAFHEKNEEVMKEDYKKFVQKYFGIREENIDRAEKLYNLAKNVAEAILLERFDKFEVLESQIHIESYGRIDSALVKLYYQTEGKRREQREKNELLNWEFPYWSGYTNDLICAYVWSVLPEEMLEDLAKEVNSDGAKNGGGVYESRLTEEVWKDINPKLSVIPFYKGQKIITNGNATLRGKPIADCVETFLRQLFTLVFCTRNNYDSDLEIAENRIPKNLRDFFICGKSIRRIANDGSTDMRTEWAEICAGWEKLGIRYSAEYGTPCLDSGWDNIIKLFCLLMKDYPALLQSRKEKGDAIQPSEEKAAQCIDSMNSGSCEITKDNVVDIVNELLGIRTDVKLVVGGSELRSEGGEIGDLFIIPGDIPSILPENVDKREFTKANSLLFCVKGLHAQVFSRYKKEDGDEENESEQSSISEDIEPELSNIKALYEKKIDGNEYRIFQFFNRAFQDSSDVSSFLKIVGDHSTKDNCHYIDGIAKYVNLAPEISGWVCKFFWRKKELMNILIDKILFNMNNLKVANNLEINRINRTVTFRDRLYDMSGENLAKMLSSCLRKEQFLESSSAFFLFSEIVDDMYSISDNHVGVCHISQLKHIKKFISCLIDKIDKLKSNGVRNEENIVYDNGHESFTSSNVQKAYRNVFRVLDMVDGELDEDPELIELMQQFTETVRRYNDYSGKFKSRYVSYVIDTNFHLDDLKRSPRKTHALFSFGVHFYDEASVNDIVKVIIERGERISLQDALKLGSSVDDKFADELVSRIDFGEDKLSIGRICDIMYDFVLQRDSKFAGKIMEKLLLLCSDEIFSWKDGVLLMPYVSQNMFIQLVKRIEGKQNNCEFSKEEFCSIIDILDQKECWWHHSIILACNKILGSYVRNEINNISMDIMCDAISLSSRSDEPDAGLYALAVKKFFSSGEMHTLEDLQKLIKSVCEQEVRSQVAENLLQAYYSNSTEAEIEENLQKILFLISEWSKKSSIAKEFFSKSANITAKDIRLFMNSCFKIEEK